MRSCGECRACCTINKVDDPDLQKPAWTACQHLCKGGCGIYASRPKACASYECAWLSGHIPAKWRPDKLGLIFKVEAGNVLSVAEVWKGAKDCAEAHHAVTRVSRVLIDAGKVTSAVAAIHP